MANHDILNPRWLLSIFVLVCLVTAAACGSSAPAATAPPAERAAATPTQPPATTSLQVGQGAVGAASPTATPVPVAKKVEAPVTSGGPKVTLLKVARGVTSFETNDPIAGRADLTFLLPMYEGLVQFDQFTDSQPMLATE